MPNYNLIKKYYDMGGRCVTLASDAHIPQNVGVGLSEAKRALREIGFDKYYYYKKRKPQSVEL